MNIVPTGVPGELYISAPYLSRGYVGRPELTAQRFLPNPFTDSSNFRRMYRTGDMLRGRFDGEVEYVGRADSEVKIRGFRVETEDIEAVLRNHEEIVEAVVTTDKGRYSERLVAWIVRKPEAEEDVSDLRRHIKKSLPDYMVPSVFIFTKRLPLNANGKIDRMALSFDATERAGETKDYKGPGNQLESAVADIWASVLEQERIGVNDDFLDLGVESVQAGLISLEIRDRFNVDIPVIMFFEGMTIATLSEEIIHIQENSM
jgi:acyl carrier protein